MHWVSQSFKQLDSCVLGQYQPPVCWCSTDFCVQMLVCTDRYNTFWCLSVGVYWQIQHILVYKCQHVLTDTAHCGVLCHCFTDKYNTFWCLSVSVYWQIQHILVSKCQWVLTCKTHFGVEMLTFTDTFWCSSVSVYWQMQRLLVFKWCWFVLTDSTHFGI